jgi:diguanylate cyclase (GGDEF)-like protein
MVGLADRRNTILVIDDDPFMLAALTAMLQPFHEIMVSRSGEEGIELARITDVDLILLDIVMKGMSGHETMVALKSDPKTKNIPVIIITGLDKPDQEIKALNAGAVDFIVKPVQQEILRLRVTLHLKLINQMRIIEQFGQTDGLTGLNNRRFFDQMLESEWARCARNGVWLSKIMIDIDHFKAFNDEHGHHAGDQALKTVSSVLQSGVQRGSDTVFRWGGEEFAVLLPETPLEGAVAVAEKVRRLVGSTPIIWENKVLQVTISGGVSATLPTPEPDNRHMALFIKDADSALYRAKKEGRNCIIPAEITEAPGEAK